MYRFHRPAGAPKHWISDGAPVLAVGTYLLFEDAVPVEPRTAG
jgi:hypothetical protein